MLNAVEFLSLSSLNTFGIDVWARCYIQIRNPKVLSALVASELIKPHQKLILGGGSNILFVRDFTGLVLHMKNDGIDLVKENMHYVWLKVAAGVNWHSFVLHCVEQGYGGVENLSLIPGTVGAAPVQNIGAYGVELSDVLHSVDAIDIEQATAYQFSREECAFGYRSSIFNGVLRGQWVITHVTLRLRKQPIFNVDYDAISTMLKEMGIRKLSVKAISDAVIKLRQTKLPNPATIGNAGSFFKNPVVDWCQFLKLKYAYPSMPGYIYSWGKVKLSAGWLIEQCGWKGQRRGDVGVHTQHALVLVNYGQGSGIALYQLARDIKKSVQKRFGVELVPELKILM